MNTYTRTGNEEEYNDTSFLKKRKKKKKKKKKREREKNLFAAH